MEGAHIEAELVPFPGAKAFDDHVDRCRQSQDRFSIGRSSQVQNDAAFAGVQVPEHAATLGMRCVVRERPQASRRVAVGRLDLDDVGANVAQQPGGVWPGDPLREIDHAQPGSGRFNRCQPGRSVGKQSWPGSPARSKRTAPASPGRARVHRA